MTKQRLETVRNVFLWTYGGTLLIAGLMGGFHLPVEWRQFYADIIAVPVRAVAAITAARLLGMHLLPSLALGLLAMIPPFHPFVLPVVWIYANWRIRGLGEKHRDKEPHSRSDHQEVRESR